MEKETTIELDELWRIGGDSEDEEEFFGVITQILSDADGNVYLLDSQLNEVKIYDSNGEYLNSIGRQGEGPGEFRNPNSMMFLPDGTIGVMQVVPGKIVKLTTDGDPAGDFLLPEPDGGGFQILRGGGRAGDNVVLVREIQARQEGKFVLSLTLDLVDDQGNILSTLTSAERVVAQANLVIDEKSFFTFDQFGRWGTGADGRVFALVDYRDYAITVFNQDGTTDRVIRRDYERRKRTDEEIAEIEDLWSTFVRRVPGAKTDIGDADYDIRWIFPRDDGSLWVLNSRGARERSGGVMGTFDVFDKGGRFVREVTLRGQGDPYDDAYFFVGDRLYVVTGFIDAAVAAQGGGNTSDEDEDPVPMELICYRLDAPVIASGQ